MTLLFLSDIPWTALYQRPQALAIQFAMKYDKVIFAEPWHPTKTKDAIVPPNLKRIRLWHWPFNAKLPVVGKIFSPLSRIFHPLTTWINRKIIERECGSPDIIFTESAQHGNLVKGWPLTTVVYDYVDRYTGWGKLPDWVGDAFLDANARADLRIATHPKLAEEIMTPYVVGQGVDPYFSINNRFGKVGIYWGYISNYMDWGRILEDCSAGKIMILCGPVKGTEIPIHHNLHYLGVVDHRTLPYLARMATFGFIFWKKNDLTETVASVKAQEYLACGLPVIYSSWMKRDMGPYEWNDRARTITQLIDSHTRQFNSSME